MFRHPGLIKENAVQGFHSCRLSKRDYPLRLAASKVKLLTTRGLSIKLSSLSYLLISVRSFWTKAEVRRYSAQTLVMAHTP